MNVLIVNSNRERSPWPVPPIGACCIASAVEAAGHRVELLDLCFETDCARAVSEAIRRVEPGLIGISIRNIDNVDWQSPMFYLPGVRDEVIGPCRQHSGAPIVIGGPAVGIMPGRMLEYFGADFAVCGDGEVAIVELVKMLETGSPADDVPGLAWCDGDDARVNPPARVCNLDELPTPRVHRWVDLPRYLSYNSSMGIQTKRGCALSCSYCVYNEIEGRAYRLKSPGRIAEEVREAIEGGACSIEFVDSTFNVPLEHAKTVCRALIEHDLDAQFSTMGINPGAVDEELFDLLKRARFTEVSITPESCSQPIIDSLGKNFTTDDVARAAELARKVDLPIVWYLMFGAPGECEETVRETLAFADRYIPEEHLVLMVSGIRIFPGSPLEKQARAEGQLAAEDDLLEPVWYQPDISHERLFEMLDEAYLSHPNYLLLQDNNVPELLLKTASAIHRFLRSKRPLWQHIKTIRKLQAALGLQQNFRKPKKTA